MKEQSHTLKIECIEYFEKLKSGVIIHQPSSTSQEDFEILFVNDALKEMFELFDESLQTLRETLYTCDAYKWVTSHLQTMSDKTFFQEEHYFDTHDKYCAVETYKLNNGLIVSSVEDITETRKETLDHELSQQLSKVGHYTYFIQEDYWTSSQSLDEIFEIPKDYQRDSIGWLQLVDDQHRDEMQDYLTIQIIQNHHNFDKKYKICTVGSGEEKWVHGLGKLIFDDDGVLVKMFGTISDITEQMNIEQELRLVNDTKDKLFSIISHDLKGPISHLKLMTEALDQDIPLEVQDLKSVMNKISSTVRNTSNLLENLLLWAEAQRDHIQADIQPCELTAIIHRCLSLLNPQAQSKHITFDTSLENTIAEVDIDMMTFVIRNLISNAIKFTPRGGHIKIHLSHLNGSACISIEDNGIGMTDIQLGSLFQFKSIKRTKGTEKEKGTGLGLVLCKEFVEMNNGSLMVHSQLGKGSRFIIKLDPSEE